MESKAISASNLKLKLKLTEAELGKNLELSCAKLRPAWASYLLAFVWLAFTEAACYAYLSCLLCLTIHI